MKRERKRVYAATGPDGSVWFSVDGAEPRSSGRTPGEFLRSRYCEGAADVRILAAESASGLIRDAFDASEEGGWVVFLAGPGLAQGPAARTPAGLVAAAVRASGEGPSPPPSLGGWHVMAEEERVPYALAALRDGDPPDLGLAEAAARHDLWRRVGYADPVDVAAASRVIAAIRDPRWFVKPGHPDSPSRLHAYFGLGCNHRFGAARRAWLERAWGLEDAVGGRADGSDPRAFVHAHFRAHLHPSGLQGATVRAGKYFLDYIRAVWLDMLYPEVGDGLFAPEHFFAAAKGGDADFVGAASRAYRRHVYDAGP